MSELIDLHLRAYRECLDEIDAIPKWRVVAVNVDVRRTVCVAFAVHARVLPLRDQILDQLPKFEIRCFDRLRLYAQALSWADIDFMLSRRRVASVMDQVKQVRKQLGILQVDAQALIQRGVLQTGSLAMLGKRRGYVGLLSDLVCLCTVLRRVLPVVGEHGALRESELIEAELLAEQFFHSIALRHEPLLTRKQAARRRDLAFTLLWESYNQVRRAVQYLYWRPGEADRYILSLYKRQQRRKPRQESAPSVPEAPASAVAPPVQSTASNDEASESPWQIASPSQ